MAFTDTEFLKIQNEMNDFILKRRPPENIRNQVDLAYKIEKQSIIIYEIRKRFQQEGMVDIPIAKATFVVKEKKWKIYWQKSDLKWHSYEPHKEVKTIKAFIKIIEEDKFGCFWG
jgi:Flp pilus assembly CpaF family ATPase